MVGIPKGTRARLRKPRKTKVGSLLLAARKKKGLVLREVEEATGISWAGVAHIEKGRTVPTIKTCYILAKFYRISFIKLINTVVEDEL